MKLAEALQERADLNIRISQLNARLDANATVQEGEKPAEDPLALLTELDGCVKRLERLIAAINLTNCSTVTEGKTLTEWLARRDVLRTHLNILRGLVSSASRLTQRAARTEIKILSAIDGPAMQKEIDALSKELRVIDNRIQACSWSTELQL